MPVIADKNKTLASRDFMVGFIGLSFLGVYLRDRRRMVWAEEKEFDLSSEFSVAGMSWNHRRWAVKPDDAEEFDEGETSAEGGARSLEGA